MTHSTAASELNSDLVGRLVKVQLFLRNSNNRSEVVERSLETYTGKLVGYSTSENGAIIYLEHLGRIPVRDATQYVEIFDKSGMDFEVANGG